VLRAAGFSPEVIVSGVVEDVDGPNTETMVTVLARRKAEAVLERSGDAIVIGCDSLLDVDGVAFGKPPSVEEARTRWRTLGGRSATLMTGHCVIDARSGRRTAKVVSTNVSFSAPSDAELEALLATGEALSVAGGFTLEGRAAPFIRSIEGDALNVMGISIAAFRHLLADLEVPLLALWPAALSAER
jgi:septum formation protein